MPYGVMDERTFDGRSYDARRQMARRLWGRDFVLPDIPASVVPFDHWLSPSATPTPSGYAGGYPATDRRAMVAKRAREIQDADPTLTPEMAVDRAEAEVAPYTPSEQRMVDMYGYFRSRGFSEDEARDMARQEEEDAWRQRAQFGARGQVPPGAAPPPARKGSASPPPAGARPPAQPVYGRAESRTAGADLPLPVDAEVPLTSSKEDPWAGFQAFEGADEQLVRTIATSLVKQGVPKNVAWERAQVEASRQNKPGTTSTHAQLDSQLAGGASSERMMPNRTVPGVNDSTNVPTRVSRSMDPAEAYQYNQRKPSGAGTSDYSQRDRDSQQRGLVPVQTPDGVRYMPMADFHPGQVGREGVPGVRPDLVERGYVPTEMTDVSGNKVKVYAPDPKAQDKANRTRNRGFTGQQGPRADQRHLEHLARQAGLTVEEARKIVEDNRQASLADNSTVIKPNQQQQSVDVNDNDIAVGSDAYYQPLRDRAHSNNTRDQLARVSEVRRQAMLAGGQPTGGPGGTRAWAAGFGMLSPEWQNQVMANQLSGGRIAGATPIDAEAAHNQQLSALGLRVATGQGFNEGAAGVEAVRAQQQQAALERERQGRVLAARAGRSATTPEIARARASRALEDAGYDPVTEIPGIVGPMFNDTPVRVPSGPATAVGGDGADGGWVG